MRCWVDGTEAPMDAVDLDDLGWDHGHVLGDCRILIDLTTQDLADIGGRLHALAREFEADEPGYFDDLPMHDVPVPASVTLFADAPVELLRYLRDPFWSRETVVALLRRADACRPGRRPPTHLLQHLVDGEAGPEGLRLILSGSRRAAHPLGLGAPAQ